MSKSMSLLWAALLICMTACKKEQAIQDSKLAPAATARKAASPLLKSIEYGTDWSGTVQIAIVTSYTSGTNLQLDVKVPDGYALIGGGAVASPLVAASSAFLTASYPDTDFTTWHAASTDHINSYVHTLFGYAVGLKVTGLTKNDLTSNMWLFSNTSSVLPHPATAVTIENAYTLIGGGAKVESAGNLLVYSYPYGSTWFAASKDHEVSDPSAITAYALGLKTAVLNQKNLEVVRDSIANFTSGGIGTASIFVDTTWVAGAPGGRATYNGAGRMLDGIAPHIQDATVTSKDLDVSDGGTTAVYVLKIRQKR
ncbi:hypothetical protein [Chitinophaga sp. CF418]|uniref:hypothetical protein n=1 Tax=Chitinophaga sp. CF418 TaxID=1855287 RepID=UPI00091555EC|nr:hypothetical protein [Chitinophaga sp. CF418]SHN23751.1 hypothetical protein SAMN05216311_107196 [Chitinophaga sp. CF418]